MESRRIHNSTALSFWYFWVKPKVRNTVNHEVLWVLRGVGLWLAHHQRNTPHRFGIFQRGMMPLAGVQNDDGVIARALYQANDSFAHVMYGSWDVTNKAP